MVKFTDMSTVTSREATPSSFVDYAKQHAPDMMTNDHLIIYMNTDLYRLRDLVSDWEKTSLVDLRQWWSNPICNIIGYQVYKLIGIIPMQLKYSENTHDRKNHRAPMSSQNKRKNNTRDCVVIYKLTNKKTGKAYVGKTGNFDKRMKAHARIDSSCTLIRKAIQSYGFDNFDKKKLAACNESQSNRMEAFFIEKHKTVHPNGYNITAGNFTFTNEEESCTMVQHSIDIDCIEAEYNILDSVRAILDFRHEHEKTPKEIKRELKKYHPDVSAHADDVMCKHLTECLNELRR